MRLIQGKNFTSDNMCTELIVSLADMLLDIMDHHYLQDLLCYGHFVELWQAQNPFGNALPEWYIIRMH